MAQKRLRVWRRFTISAAHCLPGHPHCGYVHGHNYTIEVAVEGDVNPTSGMIIDFSKLKEAFETTIKSRFDHRMLNNFPELGEPPTVENMISAFAEVLQDYFAPVHRGEVRIAAIRVWETPDCWAELEVGEDNYDGWAKLEVGNDH